MLKPVRRNILHHALCFCLVAAGFSLTVLGASGPVWAELNSEEDLLLDKAKGTLESFSRTPTWNGFGNI